MSGKFLYISSRLIEWYRVNKRELPWRETKDPYLIWISEIILQQTRVIQGYDYYMRFIKAFPDVKSLADAHEDEVLKLWQGLGYYSRARNLHTAAKMVMSGHNGVFPSDYNSILSLKGIGEYTAAAVGSFAFKLPYAVVDGNVFRFLSRLFAIDTPINSTQGKKVFTELANELLDRNNPGDHNQSIMEFGALQCVPVSPDCSVCPLSDRCMAYAEHKVNIYPVKEGKTKVKERFFNYLDIRCGDSLYLSKRTGNDIWKNLYELPLIETTEKLSFEQLQDTDEFKALIANVEKVALKSTSLSLKHVLSHRIIYANFYQIEVDNDILLKEKYQKIDVEELSKYAISRLVDRYFESINKQDLFL